jgi:hypothetical protein
MIFSFLSLLVGYMPICRPDGLVVDNTLDNKRKRNAKRKHRRAKLKETWVIFNFRKNFTEYIFQVEAVARRRFRLTKLLTTASTFLKVLLYPLFFHNLILQWWYWDLLRLKYFECKVLLFLYYYSSLFVLNLMMLCLFVQAGKTALVQRMISNQFAESRPRLLSLLSYS